MIIVATQDPKIRRWCESEKSNAAAWGRFLPIDAGVDQQAATALLTKYVADLRAGEALCIIAHGNDGEIGDDLENNRVWGWTPKQIADLLADYVTVAPGVVVIDSCANSVDNFTSKVAAAMRARQDHGGRFQGKELYGHNASVSSSLPAPDKVGKNVSLQVAIV